MTEEIKKMTHLLQKLANIKIKPSKTNRPKHTAPKTHVPKKNNIKQSDEKTESSKEKKASNVTIKLQEPPSAHKIKINKVIHSKTLTKKLLWIQQLIKNGHLLPPTVTQQWSKRLKDWNRKTSNKALHLIQRQSKLRRPTRQNQLQSERLKDRNRNKDNSWNMTPQQCMKFNNKHTNEQSDTRPNWFFLACRGCFREGFI